MQRNEYCDFVGVSIDRTKVNKRWKILKLISRKRTDKYYTKDKNKQKKRSKEYQQLTPKHSIEM